MFSSLCKYVMQSGNTYYIDSAGFFCEEDGHQKCRNYMRNKGLSYEDHIIPLLEAGALTQDHDLALYINRETNLEVHNDKYVESSCIQRILQLCFAGMPIYLQQAEENYFILYIRAMILRADEKYTLLCLKDMKECNPRFYVGAFKIAEGSST